MKKGTIAARYDKADGDRMALLDRIRSYALLTIPSVLPPVGQKITDETGLSWQNVGSDGVSNLVGRLLMSLFAPGMAWFRYAISPKIEFNPAVPPDKILAFRGYLYARELIIQSMLDRTNYRTAMTPVLEQVLVAGNGLFQIQDDFSFKAFRFDHWVGRRDSSRRLMWVVTKECVDRNELSEDVIARANLDPAKPGSYEDDLDLYTLCERTRDGKYRITQELNGAVVAESTEPVSPFIWCGYQENPGEHYSRGFVELKSADLRSLNGLTRAIVEKSISMAKTIPVFDPSKGYAAEDFAKPNMTVIAGRVTGNMPDGIGFVQTNQAGDMGVTGQVAGVIEKRLGRSMLLEATSQPTGERVTATQIMRIAQEIEGAIGSSYSMIASELQQPLLERIAYMLEHKGYMIPMPVELKEASAFKVLTGLEALARKTELDGLITALQTLALVPGAAERLNSQELMNRVMQAYNINPVNLIKSDEQLKAEQAQMMQQQLGAAAAQQLIQSSGKIAEQQAMPAAA